MPGSPGIHFERVVHASPGICHSGCNVGAGKFVLWGPTIHRLVYNPTQFDQENVNHEQITDFAQEISTQHLHVDGSSSIGQLYGYRNLYVIDGSLLPGSAASANPAFTIAANAERILEALIPTLS